MDRCWITLSQAHADTKQLLQAWAKLTSPYSYIMLVVFNLLMTSLKRKDMGMQQLSVNLRS